MLQSIAALLAGKSVRDRPAGAAPDRVRIAACVLLLEMAHADDDFSVEERDRVRRILLEELKPGTGDAEAVLSNAEREQREATDLWSYTSLINAHFTDEDKRRLIESAWYVAYADGRVDQNEDHLVHKLANLLHVKHADLIAAKLRARDAR
jgi:uncharacterized tellurite resistance protein B-like protein